MKVLILKAFDRDVLKLTEERYVDSVALVIGT